MAGPHALPRSPRTLALCPRCPAHELKDSAARSGGGGPVLGSRTCSLGHHHLGFAASTVAFHGVGGYRDGVGGLGLQVCDDHLLRAGTGRGRRHSRGGEQPCPSPPPSPGRGQARQAGGARSAGRGVHPSACTPPNTSHVRAQTGTRSLTPRRLLPGRARSPGAPTLAAPATPVPAPPGPAAATRGHLRAPTLLPPPGGGGATG